MTVAEARYVLDHRQEYDEATVKYAQEIVDNWNPPQFRIAWSKL